MKSKIIIIITLLFSLSSFADGWVSGQVEFVGKSTYAGATTYRIAFKLKGNPTTYAFDDQTTLSANDFQSSKEWFALLLSAANSGATISFWGTTGADPHLIVTVPWVGGNFAANGGYQFFITGN